MGQRRSKRTSYGPPLKAEALPASRRQGIRLVEVDGRTVQGQKFYSTLAALIDDLGGPDRVTTAQFLACQNAAALGVFVAERVPDLLAGNEQALSATTMAISTQLRHLRALGFKRMPDEADILTLDAVLAEPSKKRTKKRPKLND